MEGIDTVANVHETPNAQIAIACVLARGSGIVPILGTKSISKADENFASQKFS